MLMLMLMFMYDTLIKRSLTKSQKRCERCRAYAWRNEYVFNIDLKRSSDSSGIRMSSGSEFQNDRSRDTEASGPKATSQVASNNRSQVSSGADFSDRIAGAAEVCRTSTMKGVVDKDCDLEVDTLTDGKPVELIPQHRNDMVKLPFVWDQPSGVDDRFQFSHDNVCGTVKDTVAIINTT